MTLTPAEQRHMDALEKAPFTVTFTRSKDRFGSFTRYSTKRSATGFHRPTLDRLVKKGLVSMTKTPVTPTDKIASGMVTKFEVTP